MKFILKAFVTLFILGMIFIVGAIYYFSNEIKLDADKLINYNPDTTTRIYDRNGELIANLFGKKHRLFVPFKDIPPRLIEALVAIEDTTFFEHSGVNYEAIFRAIIKDVKAMKLKEGASTLTQQLIKNTILTNEKKFKRKINEAFLALKLEQKLTKEEILERYLNEIDFGHRYFGVRTASVGYFRKELSELNIKEMAMLVGIPKATSTYDPTKHFDQSLARANTVLYRMKSVGWITEEEYQKFEQYKPVVYNDSLTRNKVPYVVDQVLRELKEEYQDVRTGGYSIYTTIDQEIQDLAGKSLKKGYEDIIQRGVEDNITVDYSDLNGAMVVLENKSAEVLALVGGVDYKKSVYNRAVQSIRQPGSSFKPFLYQVALNFGYSTQSKIADISRTFSKEQKDGEENNESEDWKPKNYSKNFAGMMTLRDALIRSRNLATINLVNEIGLSPIHKEIKKMGFKNVPADLSIALGTFGISPLEFSGYYTIFSNYGKKLEPILVKKVIDRYGNEKSFTREELVVMPAKQAYLGISILRDVVKRGTGRKARVNGIELAGKTGTTNDYKDAWFCGFSPEIEAIIWFGKDGNGAMHKESGGKTAGPVFGNFFKEYIKIHPETKRVFSVPKGVRSVKVKNVTEYFTSTSKPPQDRTTDSSTSSGKLLF